MNFLRDFLIIIITSKHNSMHEKKSKRYSKVPCTKKLCQELKNSENIIQVIHEIKKNNWKGCIRVFFKKSCFSDHMNSPATPSLVSRAGHGIRERMAHLVSPKVSFFFGLGLFRFVSPSNGKSLSLGSNC